MKKMMLILTLLISTSAFAQEEEPRLQGLMAQMGGHSLIILNGMFYDDFSVIEDSVAWINNHPKPKADFAIIKKELGAEIKLFKEIDDAAHNAANAIGVAAQEQDMLEVSKQYGVMVQSCTQCHETFRERLRAVLHP